LGGSINTSSEGGSINTSSLGGSINTSSEGGSIDTSSGGGSINTRLGFIELGSGGEDGIRTTLRHKADSGHPNLEIYLPDTNGTLLNQNDSESLLVQMRSEAGVGFANVPISISVSLVDGASAPMLFTRVASDAIQNPLLTFTSVEGYEISISNGICNLRQPIYGEGYYRFSYKSLLGSLDGSASQVLNTANWVATDVAASDGSRPSSATVTYALGSNPLALTAVAQGKGILQIGSISNGSSTTKIIGTAATTPCDIYLPNTSGIVALTSDPVKSHTHGRITNDGNVHDGVYRGFIISATFVGTPPTLLQLPQSAPGISASYAVVQNNPFPLANGNGGRLTRTGLNTLVVTDQGDPENPGLLYEGVSYQNGLATINGFQVNLVVVGYVAALNKPLKTNEQGLLIGGDWGTTANSFCQGNDPRLSNIVYTTGNQSVFTSTFTHINANMNNNTYYFSSLQALDPSTNTAQRRTTMMQKCKATFASWSTYTTVAKEQDSTTSQSTGYFINNTTNTTGIISTQIRHTLNSTLATFTGAINPPININFGDQVQLALKVPNYATGMSGVTNSVDVTFFY